MSHEATLWAVRACDVPLEERMVLVYLADCHCPDNGCLVTPKRLAKEAGIDVGDGFLPHSSFSTRAGAGGCEACRARLSMRGGARKRGEPEDRREAPRGWFLSAQRREGWGRAGRKSPLAHPSRATPPGFGSPCAPNVCGGRKRAKSLASKDFYGFPPLGFHLWVAGLPPGFRLGQPLRTTRVFSHSRIASSW